MNREQRLALAYVAGCVAGDAWCGRTFGMAAKDEEFVQAFASSIRTAFGRTLRVRSKPHGYWIAETTKDHGMFDTIKMFNPATSAERGAWLRALFDSDGSASIRVARCNGSLVGNVSIMKTDPSVIEKIARFLDDLSIGYTMRSELPHPNSWGKLRRYKIRIRSSSTNHSAFLNRVGFTIIRKQAALLKVVNSYALRKPRRERCVP